MLRVNQRGWVLGAADGVLAVIIGANRGFLDTACPRLPVDALSPSPKNPLVALTASFGDFWVSDFSVGVGGGADTMNATTIGADSRRFARRRFPPDHSFAQQLSMNAPLVVKQRFALRDLMPFHQPRIAVTAGASGRDVVAVDMRARVSGGQDVMVPVTIGATGRMGVAASHRLAVNAVSVGLEEDNFERRRLGQLTL